MRKIFYLLAALAHAQSPIEFTARFWLLNPSGTIQSGVAPVDLQRDLGLEQGKAHFYGRVVVQPARGHRILVEGSPYRLRGDQQLTHQIVFSGQTYTVEDRVTSDAELNFFFAAYQRDWITRSTWHFGTHFGVAYVDASGTVSSRTFGITGREEQSFPFPVVGGAFRLEPHRLIAFEGELRGMSLGRYGHYVQMGIHGGVNVGRRLTLLAGYQLVDADVHRQDRRLGFAPRFGGPVFSVQVR